MSSSRSAALSLKGLRRSSSRPAVVGLLAYRACVESLESRVLAAVDPAVEAYSTRANQVLDGNVTAIRSWATTNAALSAENASVSGISIWTVGAAYARQASDPTLAPIAKKAAAALMSKQVIDLFTGGNDGWPAWATADTYLRYRSIIDATADRYAPNNFAANTTSVDGKYSLTELFKYVLTQSYYAPVDQTSNHFLMNATGRYLAEQAFPGQVVKPFNNSTSDPTGANLINTRIQQLVTNGPAEYLSINYGVANFGEFLSIYQLTTQPANAALAAKSKIAYETALAMNASFWMNGQMAGPTGRGYPNTGAWGAASGDTLLWVYLGGDYGQAAQQLAYATATDAKTFAVLASTSGLTLTHSGAPAPYIPPTPILHLADRTPKIIKANFATDHQYAYTTGTWTASSESYKSDAYGPYQTTWRTRTIWTKPESQSYNATSWVSNPSAEQQADGSWLYVDPNTLVAKGVTGSGSYEGSSVFSDHLQNLNTILQSFNIPPLALAGTPGGFTPARGAFVYTPVPIDKATGKDAADGDNYFKPVLSADGKRLYVGYNSVFMSYLSSAPMSVGTRVGQAQFYNIFGGPVAGQQVDPNVFLQFAVAQETFSPDDFAGTTLAEKFANFQTVLAGRELPKQIKAGTYHPVWQYQDEKATLTSEISPLQRYADDPQEYSKGFGEDYIGGVGNTNPKLVDYANWPLLNVTDPSGTVWADQPQDGNLTLTVPGQATSYYDFKNWNRYDNWLDIGLNVSSPVGAQVLLNWNKYAGATSYKVERSTDATTWTTLTTVNAGNATTFSYSSTGLTQGTFYYFRVTPNNSTTPSAPAGTTATYLAPSNLTFSLSSTSAILLNWKNNAANNSKVEIYYSLDGYTQWRWFVGLPTSYTTRTPTYTDFTGGERVFYRVVTYGPGPNGTNLYSPPSNVVGTQFSSAYVGGSTSMPEFLAVTSASATQVQLGWADTAINETAQQIERSADGGTTWTILSSTLAPNTTTYTDNAVTSGQTYVYRVAAKNGAALSAYSAAVTVRAAQPNAQPTTAQQATGPGTVTGTTVALAVLGADDAGEAALRYNWTVTTGPGSVSFSTNYTNAAKNTVATFSRAGTYTLTATILDAQGRYTTSSVDVTVQQATSGVQVTPLNRTILAGGTLQLTASAFDQFGDAMTIQPSFTWRTTAGTVGATGLFTPPTTAGLAVVSAVAGSLYDTVQVTYQTQALPLASYTFEDGTGTSVADASGNGNTGTIVGTGVTFGSGVPVKGVSTGGLTFGGAGAVDIISTTLSQFPSTPSTPSAPVTLSAWIKPTSTSGNQTIVAKGYNNTSTDKSEMIFRINSGKYEIGSWNGATTSVTYTIPSGDVNNWVHLLGTYDTAQSKWVLYRNGVQVAISSATTTAGAIPVAGRDWRIGSTDVPDRYFTGSIDEVRISNTSTSAATALALYNSYFGPSITTAAKATRPTTTTAALSALGASTLAAGEPGLTYTWALVGNPPANVTFSANGTNTSKNTTATFIAPGPYNFVVTITDANGSANVSTVDVTVARVATVTVTPSNSSLNLNGTTHFSASAADQFGASYPGTTFTWSNTGVGAVDSSGLYTAPGSGSTGGSVTVTATAVGLGTTGSAAVTVTNATPSQSVFPVFTLISPTQGTVTTLGADDGGEANLTYTWVITSKPAGVPDPTFSINGTNAAKNSVVTVYAPGSYTVRATITDASGRAINGNSQTKTFSQTVTSVTVTPGSVSMNLGQTQQFTAAAKDQFGNAMSPTFAWSRSGSVGSISSTTGLYTGPTTGLGGTTTVTATASGVSGTASVTVGDLSAPLLSSAVSRKTHGAAGVFDLNLALAGTTVEPRNGGPTQTIFTFNENVVLSPSFQLTTTSGTGSAVVSGKTITVNLSGITDAQWLTITLANVADAAGNLGTYTLRVGALLGDVSGSGAVNSTDIAIVKSVSGLAVNATNFLYDLNFSGALNSTDIAIVKSRSGLRLLP